MIDHLSPTQIESFMPSTPFGCGTRWWFDRRMPKAPPDRNLILGSAVHATLEAFLKGGPQGALHELVIQAPGALEFLLKLRKRIAFVEFNIKDFKIAGVPVWGRVDWAANPDEIGDHKTTSIIAKYAKTEGEIKNSVQMNVYAAALADGLGHDIRLTQDFYQTKGARKFLPVSVLTTKPFIAERVCTIEATVEQMVKADAALKPDDVEGDVSKCYIGFGCPHRAYCPHTKKEMTMVSLLDMFKTPQIVPITPIDEVAQVLPPDAPKSDPKLASQRPKEVEVDHDDDPETAPKKLPGRPPGARNKPKTENPALTQAAAVQVERITIRHSVRVAVPNSYGSSNGVEVEATGFVTGSVEDAKASLSLQVKNMMMTELEIYTKQIKVEPIK